MDRPTPKPRGRPPKNPNALKKPRPDRPDKPDGRKRGREDDDAAPKRAREVDDSKKWPQGLFRDQLPGLMYACGDTSSPYQETVDLVEDLALDYLVRVLHEAAKCSVSTKVGYDDVLMVLRKDPSKFARARELLQLKEEFQEQKTEVESNKRINEEFVKKFEDGEKEEA